MIYDLKVEEAKSSIIYHFKSRDKNLDVKEYFMPI